MRGTFIEAMAVVNTMVPAGTEVTSGVVFQRDAIEADDLFFNAEKQNNSSKSNKKPHGTVSIGGREYCFEDGM